MTKSSSSAQDRYYRNRATSDEIIAISDAKYLSTTTYRRSGATVATPTWIAPLDGSRLGFWTSSATGKYKRLRNDPRIVLQPSDARGRVKPGSAPVEGTAQLVTSGADFDAIQRGIRARYGTLLVTLTRYLTLLGHLGQKVPYADVVVVVSLSEPSAAAGS